MKTYATRAFNMDFTRAADLKKIKDLLTFNGQHLHFIRDIEHGKPNIVGLAGSHLEGQVLMRLEISPSGAGC